MRPVIALLALVGLTGCGWHAGLETPPGAETIGVEFFRLDDDVLQRDLEPELHDALTRAIADLVDLRLVDPQAADLVVRGRILDYGRRGGVRGKDHQLLETAVRISVEAQLERRRGGVLSRAQAALPSGYVTADRVDVALPGPPPTEETTFEVGGLAEEARARARLVRFLAEELVLELFAPQSEPVP